MPTFLSFRRAVKAHAENLGVYASLVALSCASNAASRSALGSFAGPVRANPTSAPSATAGITPVLDAGANADQSDERAVEANSSNPSIALTFEDPYPLDLRPRASNPLRAATDDEELARWNVGGTADPNYVSSQASFHPGTRVVVDAYFAGHRNAKAVPSRGLGGERVQAQTRSKGYWPFRLCFEAGQREKKGLGGETRVRFTIGTRGTVIAAHVQSSELHNAVTTACLLDQLRKLRFEPRPARARSVVASIRIWPGDADLPARSDAPPAQIETTSDFDPGAVRARLSGKRTELSACFSAARASDPNLWGRLALAIVLEADGSVHRVSEIESHFPNATAARCAAAIVSAIAFPSVNGKPFSFVAAMRLALLSSPEPNPTTIARADSAPAEPDNENDAGD
ncbi:MAG TPA: AgmX/PglI C-terminal domain-containing protein [Polyangiaceae bacterium]|jgi:hypothetical protein|nr:AgmX/PglI C-terminal domain-containing protein [Polyangiaceae bacterium]